MVFMHIPALVTTPTRERRFLEAGSEAVAAAAAVAAADTDIIIFCFALFG